MCKEEKQKFAFNPTETKEKKETKKYSIQDLIFVALIFSGIAFISMSIIHNENVKGIQEEANKNTITYNQNLNKYNEILVSTIKEKNEYKKDGSLFFNHLLLAHQLKNATTTEEYFNAQGNFMTKYYEIIYTYSDANINENLKKLNDCYVELNQVKSEAGDINAKERECADIDNIITWQLYDKLKNKYKDVFSEIENENLEEDLNEEV